MDRDACVELDRGDSLAAWRDRFVCPEGVIYLDGNSLGALPTATASRLAEVVQQEWGIGLIRSWDSAHWIDAPTRIGDKIARLIGAGPGEVVAADSTSVNLFKLLAGVLKMKSDRSVVLTERQNFPTDLYVAQSVVGLLGGVCALRVVDRVQLESALDRDVAVLALTHVDYTSGALHDMARLTEAAHRAGALALWDLSHSAGAVSLDVNAANVDLAVGCGYKYLNGGPGAPAYLFVARRWHDALPPALSGWMGHAAPFGFEARYRPAPGIKRQLAGTPLILGMAALEVGIDLWLEVDRALAWRKAQSLGDLFIRLVDGLGGFALQVASPRDATQRGAQVSVRHPQADRVMQALIDQGVIGDFRPPDLMRFGFAPLSTRYVDVWDAANQLGQVLGGRAWAQPDDAPPLAGT